MNVGQLKQSLARFNPEKDNTEVIFLSSKDGVDSMNDVSFIAYAEIPEQGLVCILGTKTAAEERMKKGRLKYPDGKGPDGINLSTNR